MSNLELNSVGFQELDSCEMMQIEGGFIPLAVMLGIWTFQGALVVSGIGLLAANK